ncbi:MAG TPA: hypothetical protein VJX74_14570 [Blastocatellia bacterium]|nr:hypothetical protein [Blastocatellia bacterium]
MSANIRTTQVIEAKDAFMRAIVDAARNFDREQAHGLVSGLMSDLWNEAERKVLRLPAKATDVRREAQTGQIQGRGD